MRSFFIILNSNIKRVLKNKGAMLATFLPALVIVIVFGVFFNGSTTDEKREFYIVNSEVSTDSFSEELIDNLKDEYKITVISKEDALENLKKKRIAEFYEIPDNFTADIKELKKPQIIVRTREKANTFSDFNIMVDSIVNKLIISKQLESKLNTAVKVEDLQSSKNSVEVISKDNTVAGQMTLAFLISFLMYSSIGISYDLFHLKRKGTLRRALTTANKPSIVIGAILGAKFVIIAIGYTIINLVNIYINAPYMKMDIPIILCNVVALTLVGLSLSVFTVRIVKNEALIAIILQGIISVTCFIGGAFLPYNLLPENIKVFSKFTPQYWSMESIASGNFMYILVVLLFAVVLFTAGTVSARSFAEV